MKENHQILFEHLKKGIEQHFAEKEHLIKAQQFIFNEEEANRLASVSQEDVVTNMISDEK